MPNLLTTVPATSAQYREVSVFSPIATPKWSCYFLYVFSKVLDVCNEDAAVFKDFSGDDRFVWKKKFGKV